MIVRERSSFSSHCQILETHPNEEEAIYEPEARKQFLIFNHELQQRSISVRIRILDAFVESETAEN
jgi:hypothetical protein